MFEHLLVQCMLSLWENMHAVCACPVCVPVGILDKLENNRMRLFFHTY